MSIRAGFSDDENYIKWLECRSTDLNREISRLEFKLQEAKQEISDLEDANDAHVCFPRGGDSVAAPVGNQCDGCARGMPVCDKGFHRRPEDGVAYMTCEKELYT